MQLMSRMLLPYCLSLVYFLSVTFGLTVVLGDTVTIPCHRSCSTVKWFRKDILVYRFTEGHFSVAPEFKDRIEFSEANLKQGNVSLTITSTVYNDRSWYICSCDGDEDCGHYLEVLIPTPLTAIVGEKAKLPCYAETDKRTADSEANVRWEKDDKLVVKLEHGEMEFGASFKDRASVSKENYNKGDLSLTIRNIRLTDAGFYRCFVQNEKSKHPEIITFIVKDSPPCCSRTHYIPVVCAVSGATVFAAVLLSVNRQKLCTARLCPKFQHHTV
ncbi:sodium channel subunit beta-2 [Neoarius graeffei]|uniref:sodium channel subunit beta-2 n=1 Tax=Neoarius graeffei TaxID=443677 RepID=UPI00298CE9D2|nr:sodium channel subunit beta-2 [Neoarius graeffei]